MFLRPKTLSGLLNFYLAFALIMFTFIAGIFVHQLVSHTLEKTLHDKANALSQQLALVTLDSVLIRDYAVIERFADDLIKQGDGIMYLKIVTTQAETLAETGNLEQANQTHNLWLTTPIMFLQRPIGYIEMAYSQALVAQTFNQIMALGIAGLVMILLFQSWFIKRLLQQRLIHPVTQLLQEFNPLKNTEVALDLTPHESEEVKNLRRIFQAKNKEITRHIKDNEQAHQLTQQAIERLRDGQRLAAIGQMAAGLAHNLNTPLANIIGYAQMAYASTDDDAMQQRMLVIERQAKNSAQMVRSLLTAARAPKAQLQSLLTLDFLTAFNQLVKPVLQQKGLKNLQTDGENVCIEADLSLLEQVLFNLLGNAVEAGADQITITSGHNEHQAWLQIIDNGEGIKPENQTHIFEAFMTTKPAGKGTGLGLYLSVQMLKSMQAKLSLTQSEPGQTCFQIEFPLCNMSNPQCQNPV
ncbi:MAG: sensor histidine kinase [Thiomicrospira sp.]